MNCDNVQTIILRGSGVSIPAEAAEHMNRCDVCQAFLDDYKLIKKLNLTQSAPSLSIDTNILNFARDNNTKKQKKIIKFVLPFLAAAACFALILTVIFSMAKNTKPPKDVPIIVKNKNENIIKPKNQIKPEEIIIQPKKEIAVVEDLEEIEYELTAIDEALQMSDLNISKEMDEFSKQIFNMETELD